MKNSKSRFSLTAIWVVSICMLAGCNSNTSAKPVPASTGNLTPAVVPTERVTTEKQHSGVLARSDNGKLESVDLSEQATNDDMTIKRLGVGDVVMDVLDPNPKDDSNSTQPGVLTMALCAPRITDKNLHDLSSSAYPIILSSNSQMLMHRDTSYQFGDGSSASSAPPYVLMTCKNTDAENDTDLLSAQVSSPNVQVKHMHASETTMEVLNPNPTGSTGEQTSDLILVMCSPRITDANLSEFAETAYPILLSQGSQIAIKRDTNYQFGDGSSASSAAPEVVLSCE